MESLDAQREAVIREVYESFAGVSRIGGVSWRASQITDMYGDESHVDYIDRDTRWEDLIDDPEWDPDGGIGGFSFLDAIGFRYYLPAALIRTLRSGYDAGIAFHLRVPRNDDSAAEYLLMQFRLLNEPQCRCVRRFVETMIGLSKQGEGGSGGSEWRRVLKRHWNRY